MSPRDLRRVTARSNRRFVSGEGFERPLLASAISRSGHGILGP